MATVRKGYCSGCPFNYGDPATEIAYNLGCLPTVAEIAEHCGDDHAWPCHSEPEKVCCGHASHRALPLKHMDGVHRRALSEQEKGE